MFKRTLNGDGTFTVTADVRYLEVVMAAINESRITDLDWTDLTQIDFVRSTNPDHFSERGDVGGKPDLPINAIHTVRDTLRILQDLPEEYKGDRGDLMDCRHFILTRRLLTVPRRIATDLSMNGIQVRMIG